MSPSPLLGDDDGDGAAPTNNKDLSIWAELRLLLWKNWVLKKRHLIASAIEILLPLMFVIIIVLLQKLDSDIPVPEDHYTCPVVFSVSPSLLPLELIPEHLFPPGFNRNVSIDGLFFEMITQGLSPGIQTVPPLLYMLMITAKLNSRVALAPIDNDPAKHKWISEFNTYLSDMTTKLDHPLWQILSEEIDLPICPFSNISVIYPDANALMDYITSKEYGNSTRGGDTTHCPSKDHPLPHPKLHLALVLHEIGDPATGTDWKYAIHTNLTSSPLTYPEQGIKDELRRSVTHKHQDKYMMSGFLTLQLMADRFIVNKRVEDEPGLVLSKWEKLGIEQFVESVFFDFRDININDSLLLGSQNKPPSLLDAHRTTSALMSMPRELLRPLTDPISYVPNDIRMAEFPTGKHISRPFFSKVEPIFALFMVLTYLWPTSRLLRGLVHEKETRVREGMYMMGLRSSTLHLSWFITYAIIFAIMALLLALIASYTVFSGSAPTLLFSFFFLFGLAVTSYCFMISVFFGRAKTASTAGVTVFFLGFLAYFAVVRDSCPMYAKAWASLLAPTAFGLGANMICHFEGSAAGVSWSNMHYKLNENMLPMADIMAILAFDAVLYAVIGLYLDCVIPQEFGVALPWYFLFTPSYWCKPRDDGAVVTPTISGSSSALMDTDMSETSNVSNAVEMPSQYQKQLASENRCVKLSKLTKVFDIGDGKQRVAVNKVDLTMYEGQITVLLGHNGAGKTSTISCISGVLPISSGSASVFGHDVATDMSSIRRTLGVCPQHDVLFDDMTVLEHLWFFARLKRIPTNRIKKVAYDQLVQVGLVDKQHALSQSLSGGQKRKLSVAIALLGDSKIVFLDEPTSGMDPYSRRSTWEILRTNTAGRVIVITTHFMDEADVLGDQIAIMSEGELKCSGSPMFLKSKYGVGYSLTVVGKKRCSVPEVRGFVSKYVGPDVRLLSNSGSEMTFRIPFELAGKFPSFFRSLDAKSRDLRVSAYGISVTTLEEVFIRVAAGEQVAAIMDGGGEEEEEEEDDDDLFRHDETEEEDDAMQGTLGDDEDGDTDVDNALREGVDRATTNSPVNGSINRASANRASADRASVKLGGDNAWEQEKEQDEDVNTTTDGDTNLVAERDTLSAVSGGLGIGPMPPTSSSSCSSASLSATDTTAAAAAVAPGRVSELIAVYDSIATDDDDDSSISGVSVSTSSSGIVGRESKSKLNGTTAGGVVRKKRSRVRGLLYNLLAGGGSTNTTSLRAPLLIPSVDDDASSVSSVASSQGGRTMRKIALARKKQPSKFLPHMRALLIKRFQHAKRDRKSMCCNTILPILNLALGLSLMSAFPLQSPPGIELDLYHIQSANNYVPVNYSAVPPMDVFKYEPEVHPMDAYVGMDDKCTRGSGKNVRHGSKLRGMSQWLLDNRFMFGYPVYGAVQMTEADSKLMVGATLFVNSTANHGPGVMMNYLNSALAKTVGKGSTGNGYIGNNNRNIDKNVGRGNGHIIGGNGHIVGGGNNGPISPGNDYINGSQIGEKRSYVDVSGNGKARELRQTNGESEPVGITTIAHPFPFTSGFTNLIDEVKAISIAVNLVVSFAFVAPSIVVVLVKEREVGAKHQQMLGGASMLAYWMSSFIWDFGIYLITFVISMAMITFTPTIDALHGENLLAVAVLLLGYGVAMIPFTYCLSFAFKSHSTAQNVVLLLNFIAGLVLMITSFIMSLIKYTRHANDILCYFWRLFPGFCLGNGLLNIALLGVKTSLGLPMPNPSPFAWEIIGKDLCFMGIEAVVYFVFCLILETYPHLMKRLNSDMDVLDGANDEDEDVLAERNRVNGGLTNSSGVFGRRGGGGGVGQMYNDGGAEDDGEDAILLKGLRKVYGGKRAAVKDLSFGIKRGECFGFLGVNGAGKTSTMKMLTGQILPTSGGAKLNGIDAVKDQAKARNYVGYCPQFDSVLELLTPKEHLMLYGRLKLIPEHKLEKYVNRKLKQMRLMEFKDQKAGTLSGGNKRKLCVAVALMGSPPIVFLDEPSTGMDPMNKRFMWNQITRIAQRRKESTVVLTTHSMEECEALCSTVGIMVNGRLKCLGPIQHLKHRFGNGLTVQVKLRLPSEQQIENVRAQLGNFPAGRAGEKLTRADLRQACILLGNRDNIKLVRRDHTSGWVVHNILAKDGAVSVASFAEWWIAEAMHVALTELLMAGFPGIVCLERHGNNSTWRTKAATRRRRRSPTSSGSTLRASESGGSNAHISGGNGNVVGGDNRQVAGGNSQVAARQRSIGSIGSVSGIGDGGLVDSSIGQVFEFFEANKDEFNMEDYSVTQTTLEQIFIQFAAKGDEEIREINANDASATAAAPTADASVSVDVDVDAVQVGGNAGSDTLVDGRLARQHVHGSVV